VGRVNALLGAFNRGVVSNLALARIDIARIQLSAALQTNWMPRTLGPMMVRAGLAYTGTTNDNQFAKHIPFIFSSTDLALIELTDQAIRVIVDDVPITRGSVSSAVTNGTFNTNLTGWTDSDEAGATSAWATGGYASLTGTGFNAAILRQEVTVAAGDQNDEHALRVVVNRGPVLLRVGSAAGGDQYISETSLGTGTHSLAFTPTGNFHIQIFNRNRRAALVDSVTVEAAGVMELPAPWIEDEFGLIRYEQSGDIVYVACSTEVSPRKIERRGARSWSIVTYAPNDGPFRNINVTPIRLTPSATVGNITLAASADFFKSTNVGSLFSIESVGQKVTGILNGDDQFTNEIRVTGVGATRQFIINIDGTFSATLTLQRSVSEPGAWVDVASYTTTVPAQGYVDGLDNQIIYYRIGIKSGAYTSGSADVYLEFSGGSRTGIVRVTGYTSETQVDAEVLTELGGTTASTDWSEGAWSQRRGFPSSVALYEGRLWWAGKGFIWGSVSDAYESFDPETEGDSGPISRSIGFGPVDSINWLAPLERLVMGTAGAEVVARSSTFDEPLTPTNFNLKAPSTQGSANIAPVLIDAKGLFVQKSGERVYELDYNGTTLKYESSDLTVLVPEIGRPGIAGMAVQRSPDTRVHCWRTDGKVAVLVFDRAENVICWVLVETDGFVEDVVVLPGTEEDSVYYTVRRTVDGSTVRYREKWALESTCTGLPEARIADAHIMYSGAATTTITGLDHLEGETVVCWGWNTEEPFTNSIGTVIGLDLGTFVVSGGQITGLSDEVTDACVGLAYTADFKSTKLAFGAQLGTALTQKKKIKNVGFILINTHIGGLQYGPDFDHLNPLPLNEGGRDYDEDHIWGEYDFEAMEFDGDTVPDARFCLRGVAPRPATVLAAVLGVEEHDK
jgi:hypothetical protein